jgi:hypothetical protein
MHLLFYNLTFENSIKWEYKKIINYQDETGESAYFLQDIISCQFMQYKNLSYYPLICFIGLDDPPSLSVHIIDVENNFNIIERLLYNEIDETIMSISQKLMKIIKHVLYVISLGFL